MSTEADDDYHYNIEDSVKVERMTRDDELELSNANRHTKTISSDYTLVCWRQCIIANIRKCICRHLQGKTGNRL